MHKAIYCTLYYVWIPDWKIWKRASVFRTCWVCQPKTPLGWFPASAFKTVASSLLPELHVRCPPFLREGLNMPRVKFHQANVNGTRTYLLKVFYCWLFCSVSELGNNCLLITDLYLIQAYLKKHREQEKLQQTAIFACFGLAWLT